MIDPGIDPGDYPTTLTLPHPVAVGQAIVAVVDQGDDYLAFVLREYGVLVTTRERAMGMNAPTIPPDVPLNAR